MLDRRAFLGGIIATGLVAGTPPRRGLSAEPGNRLPGWLPPVVRQTGPTCVAASAVYATQYLMGRAYGWKHKTTPIPTLVGILSRADRRGEKTRSLRVLTDANLVGYRWNEHQRTTSTIGWYKLFHGWARDEGGAAKVQRALRMGQPVLLSARFPHAWQDSELAPGCLTPRLVPEPEELHAVMAYAWDGWGVYFINSWGTGWGEAGHGRMNWEYFEKHVYETYAVSSVRAR